MAYEFCQMRVHNKLPTSDSQIGRGLCLTHAVLREAREGSLIAHGRFLDPQEEVVFFISDVVPGDRGERRQEVKRHLELI